MEYVLELLKIKLWGLKGTLRGFEDDVMLSIQYDSEGLVKKYLLEKIKSIEKAISLLEREKRTN